MCGSDEVAEPESLALQHHHEGATLTDSSPKKARARAQDSNKDGCLSQEEALQERTWCGLGIAEVTNITRR